ncbi:hypothetical protein EK21DRAFT_106216 [Setomelanomma holmii]|uniref:Uncharacterized protein n=1 Tax=Setomelanomma holmii TaxID=210430 RepID=A0A9P4HM87_9PLEO|nr:hypothetical protein EK21DRAFT_106216 [Setomelanomma holmii]
MAANDYSAAHPQTTSANAPQQYKFPADYRTASTSYEPYRRRAASNSYDSSTDRGFLHPSSHNGPVLKKSKSERAIKFVEKQVKKQIDKKLHRSGLGGQGKEYQDQFIEGTGQDSSGNSGGEYGYGDSSGGYGFDQCNLGDDNGGNFDWAGSAGDASGWFGDLDLENPKE